MKVVRTVTMRPLVLARNVRLIALAVRRASPSSPERRFGSAGCGRPGSGEPGVFKPGCPSWRSRRASAFHMSQPLSGLYGDQGFGDAGERFDQQLGVRKKLTHPTFRE